MIRPPADAAAAMAGFRAGRCGPVEPQGSGSLTLAEPGAWRRLLLPAQAAEVEAVAGQELRRVGYGSFEP